MTCVHGSREGHCPLCRGEAQRHPQDVDDCEGPPIFVLRCQSADCGCEEPAPIDMAPGDTADCAYCGEAAEVEMA